MKRSFKRMGLGVLAGALILGLAACGGNKNSGSTDKKTDFKGETLKIGVWGGNESEEKSLDALIKSFEEETGAKIEKKVYTEYNTQIQTDLVGRTAPDAFYVDASMYPFFQSQGALAPLDKKEFESDAFYDTLIDTFSTDGELYAVPKDFSTLALYLNTDVFEKAGVSVDEVPGSYEKLVDWLPGFQEKVDKAFGKGKVLSMSYNQELARNLHIAQRDGGTIIDKEGRATLEDKKVVENLSILNDLTATKAYVTPQDIGAGWNGEAFGVGKLAMMEEGNWVYQTLKDEYKDVKFTVKPMQTYKGEKGSMMFSVGWGKYSGTKQNDLADKWIKHVTGKEGMTTWVTGTGTLPSREDVATAAKVTDNPDMKVHLDAWEYATPWQKGVSLTTIDNAFKNFVPKTIDGTMSMEDAMKKADEQANTDIDAGK